LKEKNVNERLYHQFANAVTTYLILEAWLCHNTATTRWQSGVGMAKVK